MGIKKYNKTTAFTSNIEHNEFKKLEELYNEGIKSFSVLGVYVTGDFGYGKGCFIKSDDYNVTLPQHQLKTVENILDDQEAIDEINAGIVVAKIYEYELPRYKGRKFYNIEFDTNF